MSDEQEVPGSGLSPGEARYKHEIQVKDRKVMVNVISFAQIYVRTKSGEFRSCDFGLIPQVIPSTGETVFRMDLTKVEAMIERLREDGVFREEAEYLGGKHAAG